MRILPTSLGAVFYLLLVSVLCSTALSLGRDVEVVGYTESSKLKIPHAFLGLRVTIECKVAETKDHLVTRGSGEVDQKGKFSVNIPLDIVGDDGALKEDCYAQLHSASGNPCPAHNGLEASKIVLLSKSGEKKVLDLKQNLKFSPEVCVSKFFFHMPKYKFHLPKPFPKIKKPCPPKLKLPPLVPIYKPPVVIHKTPVPIYKKPYPHKDLHPIYKPHVPIYKPSVPIYKPPVVIYKPPVVIPKKPCPPLLKFPHFPPKYIPHPKLGKWAPFPSHP